MPKKSSSPLVNCGCKSSDSIGRYTNAKNCICNVKGKNFDVKTVIHIKELTVSNR